MPAQPMDEDAASTSGDGRQCRICWGEEGDAAEGLAFVSPCKCAGSLNHIHVRCLQDWQQVLRSQGQFRKARHCEICKQPYKMPVTPGCGGAGGSRNRWLLAIRACLTRASQALLESLHCASYGALLYRAWKLYVLGSSVWGAARLGASGLRAGFGMGRTLVEEQTGILLRLLAALGELLGTPYAELLWCQAVACVAFALVSEMVYTSLLGLLVGGVYGFMRGYMAALQVSVGLAAQGASRSLSAGRSLAKAAGLALRFPWAALRAAAAAALRTLPLRIL